MSDDNEFADEDYINRLRKLPERDFKTLYQGIWIPPDDELKKELGFFGKPHKRDHTLDNGRVVNVDYLPEPDEDPAHEDGNGDGDGA